MRKKASGATDIYVSSSALQCTRKVAAGSAAWPDGEREGPASAGPWALKRMVMLSYTEPRLVLMVLNVLPMIGPRIIRAAITTMATRTRINAYSTSPWPFSLGANNMGLSSFPLSIVSYLQDGELRPILLHIAAHVDRPWTPAREAHHRPCAPAALHAPHCARRPLRLGPRRARAPLARRGRRQLDSLFFAPG